MTDLIPLSHSQNKVMQLAAVEASELVDRSLSDDKQAAQEIHYKFVSAAKTGRAAATAVRDVAAEMWLTQSFLELELPYDNDPAQKITFDDYGAWLGYACDKAELSEATASTVKNFILNVVDPVAKQLVMNPHTKEPYTVAEVLDLREGHTQRMASAARTALRNPNISDEEKYGMIADVIDLAQSSPNLDDYISDLRDMGLAKRRSDPMSADISYVQDKVVVMIVAEEAKLPLINAILEGRFDMRMQTVDDMLSQLMKIQVTADQMVNAVAPVEDDPTFDSSSEEPSEEDVKDWLEEL